VWCDVVSFYGFVEQGMKKNNFQMLVEIFGFGNYFLELLPKLSKNV